MKSAVLVIDAQKEYGLNGALAIEGIEAITPKINSITEKAREKNIPVVQIRHVSRDPDDSSFVAGSKKVEFLDDLDIGQDDKVITKQYPGSFTETGLDRYLSRMDVSELIICGYTSFLCCDTTARQAFELGYDVQFVEDAIGEFALNGYSQEDIHQFVCAVQAAMFSSVVTTEEVLKNIG